MKKIISCLMAFAILFSSFAATSPVNLPVVNEKSPKEVPVVNANSLMLPIGKEGKTISLMELSKISTTDFENLSGKKLNTFDKIGFKLGQKKLRGKIDADGAIKSKTLKKYASKMATSGETGFHIGGFALGFFVGLIGVLIAYLINDDYKRNRVKWAWIGFGVFVVLYIVALIALI